MQIPCLGWQPKFLFSSVILNSEACFWSVRHTGTWAQRFRGLWLLPSEIASHLLFLLFFFE